MLKWRILVNVKMIIMACMFYTYTQQSISFPAWLVRSQGVIENLEQNRPESRKIETVTSFGVAQRDVFSGCSCMYWITPFQAHVNFFWIFLWRNC